MNENLARQLVHAVDAAWDSYRCNVAVVCECLCALCGGFIGNHRAPFYAVMATAIGVIYFPVCQGCASSEMENAENAHEKYLAAHAAAGT